MTHITFGHPFGFLKTERLLVAVKPLRYLKVRVLAYCRESDKGGTVKIACCTVEMIALVFLLFVSINGGLTAVNADRGALVSRSTSQLIATWGEPDRIDTSRNAALAIPDRANVEVWTYSNPARSVVIRDDIIVSIRYG